MDQYTPDWYIKKGNEYIARAETSLNRMVMVKVLAGFLSKLFSSKEERKDSAKESYEHAGNCFKLGKDCKFFISSR
jgi:hypothetical protein